MFAHQLWEDFLAHKPYIRQVLLFVVWSFPLHPMLKIVVYHQSSHLYNRGKYWREVS